MERVVVALGGNALLGSDESATIENQREHARETTSALAALQDRASDVVLTHGNGPQVGSLLLEQEDASGPEYPLDVLVAETQAQVGYVVASEFDREFDARTVSVVTRVLVDPADPEFEDPTKPVGPYYDEQEAQSRPFDVTEVTTPEGETAFRRVVPSPRPTDVVESRQIRTLLADGATVVCGGGGGVPLVETAGGREGVEAVVDKDYTSKLIASAVDATTLVMVTDVPCVYRAFGTPEQEPLQSLTPSRVRELLESGEFAEGSIRPKMEACVSFVEHGGERAIVCDRTNIEGALAGTAGTTISE